MRDDLSDRDFAAHALKRLDAAAPPGLERKLLADYDAWNARRGGARRWLPRLAQSIWPDAPVWAPISALAFALLLGAGLGTVLPRLVPQEQPLFSLERPAPFSLLAPDPGQEDL